MQVGFRLKDKHYKPRQTAWHSQLKGNLASTKNLHVETMEIIIKSIQDPL